MIRMLIIGSKRIGVFVFFFAFSAAIFPAVFGCGKKALPIPPGVGRPQPILFGQARKTENGFVILRWRAVKYDTSGRRLDEPVNYRIFRKEVKEGCSACSSRYELFLIVNSADPYPAKKEGEIFELVDEDVRKEATYYYKIIPYTAEGVEGGFATIFKATRH